MSDKKSFDETIGLLLPYMSDVNSRRALVESTLFGCPVLSGIEWSGTERAFTISLVQTLLDFGECVPGRPAIVLLLEVIKGQSGFEKQALIDHLIRAYQPAQNPSEQPQPGAMISGYRLIRELGEGGNGTVWLVEKALPEGAPIQRAMKILRQEISGDAVRVQRFRKEIGIAARLGEASRSLHILPVYDWDKDGTFVVMKYVAGETLRQRIEGKRHTLDEALVYLEPLAKALDDAHTYAEAVIHRDVKPENVLLGERLYLADFGLAVSPTRGEEGDTRKGERPGTGRYMAPEQWREETLSIRTDLYALAIMAYEMLTGHLPFMADNDYDRAKLHCETDLPNDAVQPLPREMLAVLRRGAAKNPDERYTSASEFVHQLKNWAEGAETLYARSREYTDKLYYQIEKLLYAQFVDLEGEKRILQNVPDQPQAEEEDWLFVTHDLFHRSAPTLGDYAAARPESQRQPVINVRERLLEIERGVLVGEPGAGKTWMLMRTAYDAILKWRSDPDHAPIPVLVLLNRFNGQEPFAQYVRSSLRMLAPYAERLQRDGGGRLLLLCDALNEMPQTFIGEVVSVLKDQPRFIVSCRVRDYSEQLKELHPLEQVYLHDLELPAIEALITKRLPGEAGQTLWQAMGGTETLLAFWKKVQMHGDNALFWQAKPNWDYKKYEWRIPQEWRAIHEGARLIALSRNPYMGHLLCQVYQEGKGELPRNRAELFKRFVETLVGREIKTSQQTGRTFPALKDVETALVALARALQDTKRTVMSEEAALSAIGRAETAETAETLLKAAVDANILSGDVAGLKFAHQLLQEYFAARVLLEAMEGGESAARFFGLTWWEAGAWRETIVILGEFLGGGAYGPNRVIQWLAQVTPDLALEVLTRHGAGYTLADVEEETKTRLIEGAKAKTGEINPVGRAAAYRILGLYEVDKRRGMGVLPNGLPDIEWMPIPDDGEWTYQKEKHPGLPTFQMSKYPITYAQFQAFIDDPEGFKNPDWWESLADDEDRRQNQAEPGEQAFKYGNHPRENVSWYDAMAFCRWLTAKVGYEVRLPTEFEWEKAARGTDGRLYPYGNEFDAAKGNTNETGIGQTSAVGLFPGGASPYGVEEMSGNVWEWCLTDYRKPALTAGEENMSSNNRRVQRGGSWNFNRDSAPAVFRVYFHPYDRNNGLGFRVCVPPSR